MSQTLLTSGRIYAPGHLVATALVVDDGLISYIGDDDQALRLAPGAARVDLAGRLVTPAFVDAHVHTIQTGQVMAGLNLAGANSLADVLDAVARYGFDHVNARVIVGQGWDERGWLEQRPPLRSELDRAAGNRCVYLARVDVHSAVVSSALLDQLPGIEEQPGFTTEGFLTRDAHHQCRSGMDALFSDAERREFARLALEQAARMGIAAVHELGGTHLGPLEDLTRVGEVAEQLGIGMVTYWGELADASSIARARSVGAVGLAGDLCVDGAIGSRTAALFEPYSDADSSGFRYLDSDQITDHVVACTRADLQAGFHCIGDDGVAATVEGFRKAAAALGAGELIASRHRLEHLEMINDDDMTTLAELGVVASMQPGFDALWGGPDELYEQRLGLSRGRSMNRFGSLDRAGVALALGSDSPVTPLAGWQTIRAATQHWQQSERLSVTTAFAAATRGGHRAARDDTAGLIEVAAPAHLAIWDGASVGADGLPELDPDLELPGCAATMASGRFIFSSDDLVTGVAP